MRIDHFNNGSIDLFRQRPGAGVITEPAGTQLRLYVPTGTNGDITLGLCPLIYQAPGIVSAQRINGPWSFDLKVDQLTNGNTIFVSGLLLWRGAIADFHGSPYGYEFGYYGGESSIIISYWTGSFGSGSRLATSAQTKPNGSTVKHIYRVFINPLNQIVRLADADIGNGADSYLYARGIGFAFSANDGSSWTFLHQRTMEFQVENIGIYLRNWSSAAGVTHEALFDYFSIRAYDWEAKTRVYVPAPLTAIDSVHDQNKQTTTLITDEVKLTLGGGGQKDFVNPAMDRGAFIPGPVEGVGEFEREIPPTAGVEDQVGLLSLPGDRTAAVLPGSKQQMDFGGAPVAQSAEDQAQLLHQARGGVSTFLTLPELREPFRFPRHLDGEGSQVAGAEDRVDWELGGADYQDDKLDADGKELLYSAYNVESALVIDTTQGTFGDPATGHYGAARDGKFYFNGLECSAASPTFGTVAGGPNRRTWPWWSGSEPFGKDLPSGSSFTIPSDGAIRFTGTGLSEAGAFVSSRNGWNFPPSVNFDIQIDYSGLVKSGGTDGGLLLSVLVDPDYLFYVRRHSGSIYDKNAHIGGSGASYASVATSDTSGKMRITRTGSTLRAYYWTGAAWAQIGGDYAHSVLAGKMYVLVSMWGSGGLNLDVTVSNFTINSGAWGNKAEWHDEASGAHRGSLQAMPSKVAAVATQQSVDLIDADTDKLWMRFAKGTNNALHYFSAQSQRVWNMAWSNGTLILAHGSSPTASEEGGTIVIDFTTELIRTTREAASTICGAVYSTYTSRGWNHPPAMWGITSRNGGATYVVDWDNWQIQDYRVYSVALLHSGLSEYIASGTLLGLTIHKVQRWYAGQVGRNYNWPKRSMSSVSAQIRFCGFRSDGTVFYVDLSNLYSRDRTNGSNTGWEDVMDAGTFSAEKTEALPGTRTLFNQYRPVIYGNYIFMPANEGVYRIDWTSGSWELFYGNGGTHDILRDYTRVTSISLANDGTYDLLVVSLEGVAASGVDVVKLSDHSLYGVTVPVDVIKTAVAVAS